MKRRKFPCIFRTSFRIKFYDLFEWCSIAIPCRHGIIKSLKERRKTKTERRKHEAYKMSNEQFWFIVESILQIVIDNEKEEAVKKIQKLIKKVRRSKQRKA